MKTPPKAEDVRRFLGHEVRVTLRDTEAVKTIVEGKLVAFGQGGDFQILCEDGLLHYCWPMCDIQTKA